MMSVTAIPADGEQITPDQFIGQVIGIGILSHFELNDFSDVSAGPGVLPVSARVDLAVPDTGTVCYRAHARSIGLALADIRRQIHAQLGR